MKLKAFIYTLLCVLTITACKQKTMNKSTMNNGVIQVNYKELTPVHFFEAQLFESVSYIPLQTDSNCLIGERPFLDIYRGDYYTLDQHGSKVILRFNSNGKFLNKIGSIGKGPNEFIHINDFAFNREAGTIELLSSSKPEIFKYTPEGQFLKKTPLNFPARNFVIDPHNNYWFYLGYNNEYAKERLLKTDRLLNKTEKFLPLESKLIDIQIPVFSNSEKYISLFEPYNHTVYTLDTKPTPVLKIDFGKYAIPETFFMEDPISGFNNLEKQGFGNIFKFMQNDHFMIAFFFIQKTNKEPEFNHLIVNKRNGHAVLINEAQESDAFSTFVDAKYLTNNDELVFMAQPQPLLDLKNKRGNELFTKGIPENINEVSNPIITLCKLRDF